MFELKLLVPQEHVETVSDALQALDALSVSVEDADAHTDAEQALFGEPDMPAPKPGWNRSRINALFTTHDQAQQASELLQAQDCHLYQGYLYSHPIPIPAFCALLEHAKQRPALN